MPWNNPRNWVDGETPTGAMFNAQIRDNLRYLKETPQVDGDMTVAGDVTVNDDIVAGGDITAPVVTATEQLNAPGNVALGDAPTDLVNIKGTIIGPAPLRTYTETRVDAAIAAGVLTLDCLLGTYFKVPLNANIATLTILNAPPDTRAVGISIIFTADGTVRTIAWPASVVFPSNVTPTMTGSAGKRDWITLVTEDGGTTWFAVIVGQNY